MTSPPADEDPDVDEQIVVVPDDLSLPAPGARRPPRDGVDGLRIEPIIGDPSAGPGPVDVYLYADVLEELTFAAGYRPGEASFAALLGGFGVSPGGRPFLEISAFAGLEYREQLDGLHRAVRGVLERNLREMIRGDGPIRQIVGLFVSQPGAGARPDQEVLRTHFTLFNVPFQLLMLHDPEARTLGLYTRPPVGTEGRLVNVAFQLVRRIASSAEEEPEPGGGQSEEEEVDRREDERLEK